MPTRQHAADRSIGDLLTVHALAGDACDIMVEVLVGNPAIITCNEAELFAELIRTIHGEERAREFLWLHAQGDEESEGDMHVHLKGIEWQASTE